MTRIVLPVHRFTDTRGVARVTLELTNRNRFVFLNADDFAALEEMGVSRRWFFNAVGDRYGYVRCKPPGLNTTNVSKLIMQPHGGQHVDHLDGDACNLRRENLVVSDGHRCTARCPFYRIATR